MIPVQMSFYSLMTQKSPVCPLATFQFDFNASSLKELIDQNLYAHCAHCGNVFTKNPCLPRKMTCSENCSREFKRRSCHEKFNMKTKEINDTSRKLSGIEHLDSGHLGEAGESLVKARWELKGYEVAMFKVNNAVDMIAKLPHSTQTICIDATIMRYDYRGRILWHTGKINNIKNGYVDVITAVDILETGKEMRASFVDFTISDLEKATYMKPPAIHPGLAH